MATFEDIEKLSVLDVGQQTLNRVDPRLPGYAKIDALAGVPYEQPRPQPWSTREQLIGFGLTDNPLVGAAEMAANLATGVIMGMPASGLAQAGMYGKERLSGSNVDEALAKSQSAGEAVANFLTYQPQSKFGQYYSDVVGKVLGVPAELVRAGGEKLLGLPITPLAADLMSEALIAIGAPKPVRNKFHDYLLDKGEVTPEMVTVITAPTELGLYALLGKGVKTGSDLSIGKQPIPRSAVGVPGYELMGDVVNPKPLAELVKAENRLRAETQINPDFEFSAERPPKSADSYYIRKAEDAQARAIQQANESVTIRAREARIADLNKEIADLDARIESLLEGKKGVEATEVESFTKSRESFGHPYFQGDRGTIRNKSNKPWKRMESATNAKERIDKLVEGDSGLEVVSEDGGYVLRPSEKPFEPLVEEQRVDRTITTEQSELANEPKKYIPGPPEGVAPRTEPIKVIDRRGEDRKFQYQAADGSKYSMDESGAVFDGRGYGFGTRKQAEAVAAKLSGEGLNMEPVAVPARKASAKAFETIEVEPGVVKESPVRYELWPKDPVEPSRPFLSDELIQMDDAAVKNVIQELDKEYISPELTEVSPVDIAVDIPEIPEADIFKDPTPSAGRSLDGYKAAIAELRENLIKEVTEEAVARAKEKTAKLREQSGKAPTEEGAAVDYEALLNEEGLGVIDEELGLGEEYVEKPRQRGYRDTEGYYFQDRPGFIDVSFIVPIVENAFKYSKAFKNKAGVSIERLGTWLKKAGLTEEELVAAGFTALAEGPKHLDKDQFLKRLKEEGAKAKAKKEAVAKEVPDLGKGADGSPIVQRRQLDKAGKRFAPAITLKEMTNITGVPDIRYRTKLGGMIQTAIRVFDELDPFWKENVYRPVKKAERDALFEHKAIQEDVKKLKDSLPGGVLQKVKSRKRIGMYAISQQASGVSRLAAMGFKTVPKLTEAEMAVYTAMRSRFEKFYHRINEMRQTIGLSPMKKVDNYFTFFSDMADANRLGLVHNLVLDDSRTIADLRSKARHTAFRFAKERATKPQAKLELDPFKVYEGYTYSAVKHLHMSPVIAKAREFTAPIKHPAVNGGKLFSLKDAKPNTYTFINRYLNALAGRYEFVLDPKWERRLSKVSTNLGAAMLSYNIRSALIQPTALKNTYVEVGGKYVGRGIQDIFNAEARSIMREHSYVMPGRAFDVAYNDLANIITTNPVGEGLKIAAKVGMKPLQILDMQTAEITWHGARRYAEGELGLKGREAYNYADDVVVRTQASGAISDRSPIQYSAIGRLLTTFQTFSINDFNFMVNDVLGYKNAKISTAVKLQRTMRLIAATAAIAYIYENWFGLFSPVPDLVGAYKEAKEKGEDDKIAAYKAAMELVEVVPVVGGSAKYGSSVGGPAVELANDIFKTIAMSKDAPPWWETAGQLAGIPGISQYKKSMRAYDRGGTPYEIVIGKYIERPKGGRKKANKRRKY